MVDRVRDAWIASYKLQGTFQTHYNPVFVRLYTDEGLAGTAESLAGVPQTESILKRMIGKSPVEFWQDDSIQGVLMAVHDILGQASGLPDLSASVFHSEITNRTYLVDALSAS